MIKVTLTENYAGFQIEGSYDDFNELYDSINHFLEENNEQNLIEEDMRLHVLGFLYDLRHAYQGDREVITKENELTEEQKKYYKIPKTVKKNVLYRFPYLLTDLILDCVLFRFFAQKYHSKETQGYFKEYHIVMSFYSKVIDSWEEILSPNQIQKIKKNIFYTPISEKTFLKQWFLIIDVDYITMSKKKRQKKVMQKIDEICNWHSYEDYFWLKNEIEKYAEEHECNMSEINCVEYPNTIEW